MTQPGASDADVAGAGTAHAPGAPAVGASKLSAAARPFSFNPNAKAFVFEPAVTMPVAPVQSSPADDIDDEGNGENGALNDGEPDAQYGNGDGDPSSLMSAQEYYYYSTDSFYQQGETSFDPDRRRQMQSEYFAHFPQYAGYAGGFDQQHQKGGTYSPPLVAQRRDLYFQQDLHLHLNQHFTLHTRHMMPPAMPLPREPYDPATHKSYTRTRLFELGAHVKCLEKPAELPTFLDIYKPAPSAVPSQAHSPRGTSRSLFGNTAAVASPPAAGRGVFDALGDPALATPGTGKKTGKSKQKQRKNKDRPDRGFEDTERILGEAKRGLNGIGGDVTTHAGRARAHSEADQDAPDDFPLAPVTLQPRGLHTPKHKPVKKGKAGKSTVKASGVKGQQSRNNQPQAFSLDGPSEFENATMADLHHAENAWTRSEKAAAAPSSHGESIVTIQKTVRAALNKLSIDTLGALSEALLALPLDTLDALQAVVDLIFEKAVDEPPFAQLYAQFCARLAPQMPEFTPDGERSFSTSSSTPSIFAGLNTSSPSFTATRVVSSNTTIKSFRTLLLTRCYTLLVEDEASLLASIPSASLTALEVSEKVALLKMHQKGNLIFIGELFKVGLVRRSVVHLCIDMLLDDEAEQAARAAAAPTSASSGDDAYEPNEWNVECVCVFLNTVGAKLDSPYDDEDDTRPSSVVSASSSPAPVDVETRRARRAHLVDGHFGKLSLLARQKVLPSRYRFMILDLLDLRQRQWIPRLAKTVDPKSLEQIREQAALELLHAQTPQHSKAGAHGGFHTTGGKGKAAAGPVQPNKPWMFGRTVVSKPGPSVASSKPSPYQGRTLDFNVASPAPPFHRSVSAPDRHAMQLAASAASSADVYSPSKVLSYAGASQQRQAPPSASSSSASSVASSLTDLNTGKYLPVWKRRELGLEVGEGGVKPRMRSSRAGDTAESSVGATPDPAFTQLRFEDLTYDLPPSGTLAAEHRGSPSRADTELQSSSTSISSLASSVGSVASDSHEPAGELSDAHRTQLESLVDDFYSDFYSSHDLNEALERYVDVAHQNAAGVAPTAIVVPLLAKAAERTHVHRDLCALFLETLFHRGHLAARHFHAGARAWMLLLPDVAIDSPHAVAHTHYVYASLVLARRVAFVDLLPLYAHAVAEGALASSDARAWLLALLAHMRSRVLHDAELVASLTHATSAHEPSAATSSSFLSAVPITPSSPVPPTTVTAAPSSANARTREELSIKFVQFFADDREQARTATRAALAGVKMDYLQAVLTE